MSFKERHSASYLDFHEVCIFPSPHSLTPPVHVKISLHLPRFLIQCYLITVPVFDVVRCVIVPRSPRLTFPAGALTFIVSSSQPLLRPVERPISSSNPPLPLSTWTPYDFGRSLEPSLQVVRSDLSSAPTRPPHSTSHRLSSKRPQRQDLNFSHYAPPTFPLWK